MILLVIVGTLPLFAILGIKDWIESLSSNLYVVGGALIVTGCLLFASDRAGAGYLSGIVTLRYDDLRGLLPWL